jgi:hypothetical protein
MRAKHLIFAKDKLLKKNPSLVKIFFFAGELNRGICPSQERPYCGLVLKQNHGVDEQVGYARPRLV